MPLKMKQLPESERPYEKLQIYGAKKLSNAELLAIIIKTGTKEETSVDLANRILVLVNELKELQNISLEELIKIKGIGKVKAIQIQALLEIANRMNEPINKINKKKISEKYFEILLQDELKNLSYEIIKVIMLDLKNRLIKILDIKIGNTKEINIEPAEIMKEIIKTGASKFIIVHNHPSGDVIPSKADIEFTKRMKICAKLFNISLIDHIIIGKSRYKSIFNL